MINLNFETLIVEKRSDFILTVTLNRPAARNAINFTMMQELCRLWRELSVEPGTFRCIIITGAGPAFCAGADLKERRNMTLKIWQEQHTVLEQAMLAMLECPIPIIAAVNGAAFGGGLELALACDFAYAAETATFAQSEVKIGIMPGALGTQHLPRAVGLHRANELAFTAAVFSAQEAYDWGIVNKVCAPEKLINEVLQTARRICDNAPLAIREVKKALAMSQQLDIHSGFAFEIEAYNRVLTTKDRAEGIQAFNEKRPPKFKGE